MISPIWPRGRTSPVWGFTTLACKTVFILFSSLCQNYFYAKDFLEHLAWIIHTKHGDVWCLKAGSSPFQTLIWDKMMANSCFFFFQNYLSVVHDVATVFCPPLRGVTWVWHKCHGAVLRGAIRYLQITQIIGWGEGYSMLHEDKYCIVHSRTMQM